MRIFGRLRVAVRHGDVEPFLIRDVERRSRAGSRRNMRYTRRAIRGSDVEDIDESVAAGDESRSVCRSSRDVVGVADDVERAERMTAGGVVRRGPSRAAAADEEAMAWFVERHREVGAGPRDRPRRHDLHAGTVDHGDVTGVRHVHEDAGPARSS